MLYSAQVEKYYQRALARGEQNVASLSTSGEAGSRAAGAWIQFSIALNEGEIVELSFCAFGCPCLIAVGQWLVEVLPGENLADARHIELESVTSALDLPAEKWGNVLLAEDALQACYQQLSEI